MTKQQSPVLVLTDAERAALRKAGIKVRDLGEMKPEDVVKATHGVMTLERASQNCAIAAHHAVDGIGKGLAKHFWRAGFAHPRELVGLSAQAIARRIEAARNIDVNGSYLRSLEAAVDGVERKYGSRAAASATPRPRIDPIEAPRPKLKPLPGGTQRASLLTRPYVATLDQVRITREGDTAVIEYAEDGVWGTHMKVGPELASMTDEDVLALFNGGIEASEEHRNTIDLPAIEIPVGQPQIEWSGEDTRQWLARGHVLRCVIRDDENRKPRVIIDDKDLSWEQFGQVVVTFAGWGARIVFVADDELDEDPHIEVRERNEDGR